MKRNGMRVNPMPIIVGVVFVAIIIGICVITKEIEKRTPSEMKANIEEYFGFDGDEVGLFGLPESDEAAILINHMLLEDRAVIMEDHVYLPVGTVNAYLNGRFYWDSRENLLIYTTPTDVIKADLGSREYSVGKNKQPVDYQVIKTDGGNECYVALDYVAQYTGIAWDVYENPNRVHIYNGPIGQKAVVAKKDEAVIRTGHSIKNNVLTTISGDTPAYVIDEGENWYKVFTDDGFVGHVRKKECVEGKAKEITIDFQEPEYTSISKGYTINLAWHQVTAAAANAKLSDMVGSMKGVNTISPTWFRLSDNEGNISSLASDDYVSLAHRCGMEVWALVDNFGEGVSTSEVLAYTSRREKLVNQLISAAVEHDLDGLNIDFESLAPESGADFIQFIRELSTKCRANQIVLSIDNYVPGFTDYYNRREQGAVADYVIIMGYDEYNGSSAESGPVASLPYVRSGIEATLAEVPAEKVINAIPFYSRLWKETPKTEEEIAAQDPTAAMFYPYNLSSEAVGMPAMDKIVSENGLTPAWDDALKLNYVQYDKDGSTYKLWIEDAASIQEKLNLMKEYKLAGVASWKLGLEKPEIWDLIIQYTN